MINYQNKKIFLNKIILIYIYIYFFCCYLENKKNYYKRLRHRTISIFNINQSKTDFVCVVFSMILDIFA